MEKKRNMYWTKKVDRAIVAYNLQRDDKLFNEIIYPAFYKLSTYWVNSYALPDTSAEDVCSFLFSVMHKITDAEKNSMGYMGTVAKFYLLRKKEKHFKDTGTLSYDLSILDNYHYGEELIKKIEYYTDELNQSDDLRILIQRLNSDDIPYHEANLISSGYDTYATFLFDGIKSNKKELLGKIKWKYLEL